MIIPCWNIVTSQVVSALEVTTQSGSVTLSDKTEEPSVGGGTLVKWEAILSPGSVVEINIQNQQFILLSWDGAEYKIIE